MGAMMRVFIMGLIAFFLSACQTDGATNPITSVQINQTEREQLDRVWSNTLIVMPQDPALYIYRGRNLDLIEKKYPATQRYPAVVFLHGSTGLYTTSTQITRMVHAMAAAGFVVFAPDSLARPVPPYADAKTFKSRIGYAEVQDRISEAKMVYERIQQFSWIDGNNVFVAGHSMGGMSVQNISSGEFRGYVVLGYHCGPHNDRRLEGIKVPRYRPILSIIGTNDEWFANGPNRSVNCGQYMSGRINAESVVLPGIPHDISQDATAMPKVVAFLRRNTLRSP